VTPGGFLALGRIDHESYEETGAIRDATIKVGTQVTGPSLSDG
jgi:hypothetical protein